MDKLKVSSKKTKTIPLHLKLLKEDFARRVRANPRYSLRSFAKQIDIDASLFSKVLQNKRKLSIDNAKKILSKSPLSEVDKKLFWDSLVAERNQTHGVIDPVSGAHIDERVAIPVTLLPHDLFSLISEPHHYILAELTRTQKFKSDVSWIASQLNLDKPQTEITLQRLLKVGIIQKNGSTYVRAPNRIATENKEVTDSALKLHQRRILEAAVHAMDEVPLEQRSQNSMTIAINPKKIPIAKQMIQEFINQLSTVLESGPLEEVYQISVSMFPAPISREPTRESRIKK